MKSFILAGIIFSAASASAVITKNCPDTFNLSLRNFDMTHSVDEYWDVSPEEISQAQEGLSRVNQISAKLKLDRASDAKCSYISETSKLRAELRGSTRENAVNPATLVVRSDTMDYRAVIYIPIKAVKKTGLELKNPSGSASVYYPGQYCSWGDCIPDHIYIGSVSEVSVK